MDILIFIVLPSFIFGVALCYSLLTYIQSKEYKKHASDLLGYNVDAEFDLGGGIRYNHPYRFGEVQSDSKSIHSAISKLRIIKHDGYVEIYGSWDRNNKNQIDPYSLHIPIGSEIIDSDNLIEFGQYFVDLGTEINNQKNA